MKITLYLALTVLLVGACGTCMAEIAVEHVSKARAKELGIEPEVDDLKEIEQDVAPEQVVAQIEAKESSDAKD